MPAKQILVILAVVAVMAGLLSMDIHKAGKSAQSGKHTDQAAPTGMDEAEIIKKEKSALSSVQLNSIEELEKQASDHSGDAQLKLGQKWDEFKRPVMSGFTFYELALKQPGLKNWLLAGDKLREGIVSVQDSAEVATLFARAILSYQNALKIDPENLNAKTGLGVCYVTGSSNPMEGIGLLLGVVGKDPNNVPANFNLGLFSMRSGQYDKAIGRFETVVKYAPTGEAYFYLGQAFQNLNKNKEAIAAYQNSKKYLDDPQTLSSVDHLIKQLTN